MTIADRRRAALTLFPFPAFMCQCARTECDRLVVDLDFAEALAVLIAQVGRENMEFLSGYRCEHHNRNVGGAKNSEHIKGNAGDFRILGVAIEDAVDIVAQIPTFRDGGLGVYWDGLKGPFLHADARGYRARWQRVNGVYQTWIDAP